MKNVTDIDASICFVTVIVLCAPYISNALTSHTICSTGETRPITHHLQLNLNLHLLLPKPYLHDSVQTLLQTMIIYS